MTEIVKKKLELEIQQIEYELHNELPKDLRRAIALGDLSENAEYHSAKARQEILRARLEKMKKRLEKEFCKIFKTLGKMTPKKYLFACIHSSGLPLPQ